MIDFLVLIQDLETGLNDLIIKYENNHVGSDKIRKQTLISDVLLALKHVSNYHAMYSNEDDKLSIVRIELEPFFKQDKSNNRTRIKSIGWRVFLKDKSNRIFNSNGIIKAELAESHIFIEPDFS